jgi:hypothetical protein
LAEFAVQDRDKFHNEKAYGVFPVRAFSEGLTKTTARATGGHPHSVAVRTFFNAAFMVVMMRFQIIIRQTYAIAFFCQLQIQSLGDPPRVS